MWLFHSVMSPKDASGMANSVELDQTVPPNLGLHCLLGPICSKLGSLRCVDYSAHEYRLILPGPLVRDVNFVSANILPIGKLYRD